MAVSAAITVVGAAALLTLSGQAVSAEQEPVSGGETLHVALSSGEGDERLRPGDQVEYTIRVRNSGDAEFPQAQVVAFLPKNVRHVSDTESARAQEGRISWEQPLGPGERVVLHSVGEITGVPEGAEYPVTTVCLRPEADSVLASCTARTHRVHDSVPWPFVVAAALVAAAVGTGGYMRVRSTRRPRPEPKTPSNHAPGSVPNIRTFPGSPRLSYLGSRR